MSRVVQVIIFKYSLNESISNKVNYNSFSKFTIQIGIDGIRFNDNILIQAKQEYLDSLLDLYVYQKKITFSLLSID